MDLLYTKFFVHNALKLGYWTSRLLDKGCLEVLGPAGVSNGLKHLYSILSAFDSGVLRHYAISICLAFLLILVLGFSGLDVQILWVILLTTVLVLT